MTEEKTTAQENRALRRVRSMLDLAEDPRTPEGERENAMAQAMRLMADYGINEAMASARDQIREKIVSKRILLGNPYSYDKSSLLDYLSHELNCTLVNHFSGATYISATVMGYESDVARLEMLYTSLLLQALRQLKNVRPPWSYSTPAETRKYRQNWFHGFNVRVALRVRENEQAATRKFDDEHAGGTGTALVLADRKTHVEAFKDQTFPDLADFRPRSRDGEGATEGARAGNRADIGNGKVGSGDQYKIGTGRG